MMTVTLKGLVLCKGSEQEKYNEVVTIAYVGT